MTTTMVLHTAAEIVDAARAAVDGARQARSRGERISDAELTALAASWQLRHDGRDVDLTPAERRETDAHGALVIEVGTAMVLSKLSERRGRGRWFDARREEIEGDARCWVVGQIAEYRPGTGSVAAFLASRLDWIVGDLLRTHSQGGGGLDRAGYQVRAAMWATLAELRAAGAGLSPASIRQATLERLTADQVARLVADGVDANDAQLRAVASLKKSGKFAALDRIPEFLLTGETDLSLEQPVAEDTTVGDLVAGTAYRGRLPGEADEEDVVAQLYRVALGDADWAVPVLSARLGMLGAVEGSAQLDVEGAASASRPASIPALSEATGFDRDVIRTVTQHAPVRLTSAHAQWAHLSSVVVHPGVSGTFDGFDRSVFADR